MDGVHYQHHAITSWLYDDGDDQDGEDQVEFYYKEVHGHHLLLVDEMDYYCIITLHILMFGKYYYFTLFK